MLKKIIELIKNNKRFLVTAHMNLEGDALGSELAMYFILKKMKKQVVVVNHDLTPKSYGFLPGVRFIKHSLDKTKFDVALVLDCSDSFRTGKIKDYFSKARHIVNIDHHISNTSFGDINWIDPTASSASEMIYLLSRELKIMDKNIALCLYTGIFTDTGSFTYGNTSSRVHKVISELFKYNLSPDKIYYSLHSFCELGDVSFMGRVLSGLKTDPNRKIVWAVIKHWPDKGYDLTEVIFSVMHYLKEPEVFLLFKKVSKDKVRVNFRSRSRVDVNRVAKFFGGGGHKRASGATIDGSLYSVEKDVVAFIRRYTNGRNGK